MSTPSNVLFVVLDTVRKDRLTPYGCDRPTTPNLNALSEEGTVFESAVAPAPWTLPVHASLFTGRYPSQHGANQESPYLESTETLASALSAAGYDTACYTSNAWITPYTNLTRGFDENDTFFEVMPADFLSGPLARVWKAVNDSDRLREFASRIVRIGARAHEHFASSEGADSKTPAVIDRTRTFIEESDSDRGWFAFVNLMDAHLPYYPPEEYRERFAPNADPSSVCQNSKEYNSGAREIGDDEWRDIRGLYDAEIAHADAELGRLFEWLKDTGRWDDTTVIVCSDHGELHGEHGLYGHEFALYDELINVPLIVKHPDLEAGRRDDLVELLDLYHTTLDTLDVNPVETLESEGGERPPSGDAIGLDETRSLLSTRYRAFETLDGEADPGQRAVLDTSNDSADYAFIEYARPVIELHHLEEKAANAGIDLPADHRCYARMRAARGLDSKYIRADRIDDEGYRLDDDPEEASPVGTDDPIVAAAEEALSAFETAIGGAWKSGDTSEPPGATDALNDADERTRERLRELGYLE